MPIESSPIAAIHASVLHESGQDMIAYGPDALSGKGEKYKVIAAPKPGTNEEHNIPGDTGYAISLKNSPWITFESNPMLQALPLQSRPLDIRLDPKNSDLLLLRSDYLPDVFLRVPLNQAIAINPFNKGDVNQEILIGWTKTEDGTPYVLFDQTHPSAEPWLKATIESHKEEPVAQQNPPSSPVVEQPPINVPAEIDLRKDPRLLEAIQAYLKQHGLKMPRLPWMPRGEWNRTVDGQNRINHPPAHHMPGHLNAGMWEVRDGRILNMLNGRYDDEDTTHERNQNEMQKLIADLATRGLHNIDRNTRINKGYSLGAHPREIIVVDDEAQPLLTKMYEELKQKIKSSEITDVNGILQTTQDFVTNQMQYSIEGVEKINANFGIVPGEDKEVPLEKYISEKVGVCRHMGTFNAYLLEKLVDEGVLQGSVASDRNTIVGKGAHTWARFVDTDGTIYISDPTNQVLSTLKEAQTKRIWDYARPEEQDAYPLS